VLLAAHRVKKKSAPRRARDTCNNHGISPDPIARASRPVSAQRAKTHCRHGSLNKKGRKKMHSRYLKAAALAAATICSSSMPHAAPVTYNFTVTDFVAYEGTPPPVASVTGSYTLDGSIVTQFDLTIGSRSYSAADVAIYDSDFHNVLGGTSNDSSIGWGTDDFWLQWVPGYPTHFTDFAYTVAGVQDYYSSYTGSISLAEVPVPAAAWLMGSGLMGLAGLSRRRKPSA
jgi:hypothetical protein